jgi:hypothetical protein
MKRISHEPYHINHIHPQAYPTGLDEAPFTHSYIASQLSIMEPTVLYILEHGYRIANVHGSIQGLTFGSATLSLLDTSSALDGYMYRHIDQRLTNVPRLSLTEYPQHSATDRHPPAQHPVAQPAVAQQSSIANTWMSLTPMEIESHYTPIALAKGRVGISGLGLGYYVNSIIDKPEVEEITVYEVNPDVIALYLAIYGSHPKVTIVQKNILEVKDEAFTFFYADHYEHAVDENIIRDCAIITGNNSIQSYFFWTLEQTVNELEQVGQSSPRSWLTMAEPLLSRFSRSTKFARRYILGCGKDLQKELDLIYPIYHTSIK